MKEMRNEYPSDITREQFEKIRGDLEGARKTTHPRKHDLYEVFCAVLYLVTKSEKVQRFLSSITFAN